MTIQIVAFIAAGILGLTLMTVLVGTFFRVERGTVAIVERLGKFIREAEPGICAKAPFVDRVVGNVNLGIQQLIIEIEARTVDKVSVRMAVAVEYVVLPDRAYDGFYKAEEAHRQITSSVLEVVRSQVLQIDLEDIVKKRNWIASTVKSELDKSMKDFGYEIRKTLVTEIDSDAQVSQVGRGTLNEVGSLSPSNGTLTPHSSLDNLSESPRG